MDYVDITPLEEPAKPKDQSNIVSRLLVQFMIGNRPGEPLQKLSAAMQETEFMYKVVRRTINNVDDAVLEAAMGEGIQHVQDSDLSLHWSTRLAVEP
jgi:hypothetical protein